MTRRARIVVACLAVGATFAAVGLAGPSTGAPPKRTGTGSTKNTGANQPASGGAVGAAPGPALTSTPPDLHPTAGLPEPIPPAKYSNTTKCVQASDAGKTLKNGVSWAQKQLDYTSLWDLGRSGSGQIVAVIDTGVSNVSAFHGRLLGGGDYVQLNGNGLDDCDGHGTIVAGLIAGAADAKTGFAGVAPDATIVSIRQSSSNFGVQNAKQNSSDKVAGNTESLAQAIQRASDIGATVINISEASCHRASVVDPGEAAVTTAIDNAINGGAVVVAAAGNVDSAADCNTQNVPGTEPNTLAVPARIPGVLAVGAVDQSGDPAAFTLSGSWVGVAAPGTDIISTNPVKGSNGQINELSTGSSSGSTTTPIQGTSFAAPYVSGLVALVRARFPDLSPAQVVSRIERTAVHPAAPGGRDDFVGYGVIDPQAALTDVLPGETPPTPAQRLGPQQLPAAAPHHDPERKARLVGLLGALGLLVVLMVGVVVITTRLRRKDLLAGRLPRRAPGRAAAGRQR